MNSKQSKAFGASHAPQLFQRKRQMPWWFSRIWQGIIVLLSVTIIVFLVTQALPGDVVKMILGTGATPEREALVREQLGLDQPLFIQYFGWLGGILTGDFGNSLMTGRPVIDVVGERLRNTLILAGVILLITIPLAIVIGMVSAVYRDRTADKTFMTSSMVVNATPEFVLGTLLVALFATTVFPILPAVSIIPAGALPTWYPLAMVLPVATLTIYGVMYLGRLVRSSFIDALTSEYVQNAELKGLSKRRILFVHVLPNALAPVIPAASIVAAITIGGTVVVEYLFAYPGIGTVLIEAVSNRDIPLLQILILFIASAYYILNFFADILQGDEGRAVA